MNQIFKASTVLLFLLMISCKNEIKENQEPVSKTKDIAELQIATIKEQQYDLRNDSTVFKSATIENFDQDGNSIDVYWIGEEQDTTLRFYRKYDDQNNLIGAEYYEEGDTEPTLDTVFYNDKGQKVEASLNADGNITWKSTTTTDDNDNPILKSYENSKGEYRGLDSLYFDAQNRVIKGFYESASGRRTRIKTYEYTSSDDQGNWTERLMYVNDTLAQKQTRNIQYHR